MTEGLGDTPANDELVTTYLEMTSQPVSPTPPRPAGKCALLRAEAPTPDFYRFLYNQVGKTWHWWERNDIDDTELTAIISHELVEIYVLYLAGCPAGYAELDRRTGNDIELAYFGIFDDYAGRGLGPYLLRFAIDQAWSYEPTRLWVHTCTEDSPKALPVYQRAGFEVYKRESEPLPEGLLKAKGLVT